MLFLLFIALTVLIVLNGNNESLKSIINSLENSVPVLLVKVNKSMLIIINIKLNK